ncbi:hypothetical protein JOB18_047616 [Solea senegalensis]|uniref:Secreted protein n=1 Tax=Solea senegalensis TaxID=28829 RepID=A0AAV6PWB8_SOLSE|nr:hypothetical protein JOB18_047616 [Solea senegalensis]
MAASESLAPRCTAPPGLSFLVILLSSFDRKIAHSVCVCVLSGKVDVCRCPVTHIRLKIVSLLTTVKFRHDITAITGKTCKIINSLTDSEAYLNAASRLGRGKRAAHC